MNVLDNKVAVIPSVKLFFSFAKWLGKRQRNEDLQNKKKQKNPPFSKGVFFYRRAFEIKSWSKYNPLSLTSLCVNRQTQDHWAPVGAGGNYLEKAALLQVEGGMLITSVDSQDAASSFSFVPSLYGLINYEAMHRWFIWEQEMFKPFFFSFAQTQPPRRRLFLTCPRGTVHNVQEAFNGAAQRKVKAVMSVLSG